jgi:homoserine dehydrogenase
MAPEPVVSTVAIRTPYAARHLRIGLFGFGCVGQGLHGVLNRSAGLQVQVQQVVVKHRDKPRNAPAELFDYAPEAILANPAVDTVVELIDHAEEAWQIVQAALQAGKAAVTANKKMLAEHLREVVQLQEQTGSTLLYEASCAGSIPIIRNLEEYYDNDLIDLLQGILNGTCNYILSRMYDEGAEFGDVLADAQRLGFAESDPTLDVDGFDAKYKLVILTLHAFGVFLRPEQVLNVGIRGATAHDFQFAREKGFRLQLVATSQKVGDTGLATYVLPHLVPASNLLYNVSREYNGVIVRTAFAEQQFFQGKGAGGFPTASAVLADLSALTHHYRYEYKKVYQGTRLQPTHQVELPVYVRHTPDSPLLARLNLRDIQARHVSGGYAYTIGTVTLADLLPLQDELNTGESFVAVLG